MTSSETEEKTRRPQRSLRPETPAELFAAVRPLSDLVKLRPMTGEDGPRFLARLRFSTTPEEAVTYTAFAALPPSAAGWGYECLRLMAGQDLPRVVATPQALITADNVETYATTDMAALRETLAAE